MENKNIFDITEEHWRKTIKKLSKSLIFDFIFFGKKEDFVKSIFDVDNLCKDAIKSYKIKSFTQAEEFMNKAISICKEKFTWIFIGFYCTNFLIQIKRIRREKDDFDGIKQLIFEENYLSELTMLQKPLDICNKTTSIFNADSFENIFNIHAFAKKLQEERKEIPAFWMNLMSTSCLSKISLDNKVTTFLNRMAHGNIATGIDPILLLMKIVNPLYLNLIKNPENSSFSFYMGRENNVLIELIDDSWALKILNQGLQYYSGQIDDEQILKIFSEFLFRDQQIEGKDQELLYILQKGYMFLKCGQIFQRNKKKEYQKKSKCFYKKGYNLILFFGMQSKFCHIENEISKRVRNFLIIIEKILNIENLKNRNNWKNLKEKLNYFNLSTMNVINNEFFPEFSFSFMPLISLIKNYHPKKKYDFAINVISKELKIKQKIFGKNCFELNTLIFKQGYLKLRKELKELFQKMSIIKEDYLILKEEIKEKKFIDLSYFKEIIDLFNDYLKSDIKEYGGILIKKYKDLLENLRFLQKIKEKEEIENVTYLMNELSINIAYVNQNFLLQKDLEDHQNHYLYDPFFNIFSNSNFSRFSLS